MVVTDKLKAAIAAGGASAAELQAAAVQLLSGVDRASIAHGDTRATLRGQARQVLDAVAAHLQARARAAFNLVPTPAPSAAEVVGQIDKLVAAVDQHSEGL